MRKLLFLSTLFIAFTLNAQKTKPLIEIAANDARIEYTGRTNVSENGVSYDWSGVYVRVKFKGTQLSIRCSDTKNSYLNIWVDKEMSPIADKSIKIAAKDTLITLSEGLKKGEHEVIFQKRTEGEQGKITIHSFLSDGEILQANGRKSRHIEFIGDSYTCGYGTESKSKNDPFLAETENCNLTYAAIASRYFNADFNLVAHSGQGICRNYDDFRPGYNMPDRYSHVFDESTDYIWNAAEAPYRPDIVVIYLCTNDFSTGRQPHQNIFVARYIELLNKVKTNYGEDIPILCMASNANPLTYDYIRSACLLSELKNVSYMGMSKNIHNQDSDLGASYHPNYQGHIKVASSMIPYISTITGWEMTDQPYK